MVPDVIEPESLEALRARVALFYRAWDRYPSTTRKEISNPSAGDDLPVREINWPETALRLLDNESSVIAVRRIVDALSGSECKLIHANSLLKPANRGAAVAPHQDTAYNIQALNRPLTAWIPFDKATAANGAIFYLPGSQELGELEHRSAKRVHWLDETVLRRFGELNWRSYSGGPGSIGIHDSRIVHGSHPNRSPRDRLALSLRFVAGFDEGN